MLKLRALSGYCRCWRVNSLASTVKDRGALLLGSGDMRNLKIGDKLRELVADDSFWKKCAVRM